MESYIGIEGVYRKRILILKYVVREGSFGRGGMWVGVRRFGFGEEEGRRECILRIE